MKFVDVGDKARVELPYSEVCMSMRVAGEIRDIEILKGGVQILNSDGSKFSFPVTHGEAGLYSSQFGGWYIH